MVAGQPTERGAVEDYKDLEVWQRSMELCVRVYDVTEDFPQREAYGLAGQIRRAAVSIPANIAEGHGRATRQDYSRFVKIARGSGAELETELLLAERLGMVSDDALTSVSDDLIVVRRLIQGLVNALDGRR
jgi:four helix bundle protein